MPMNSHGGAVVWLTGLSGAGKSTIARAAEAELLANGIQAEVLDGDQIRENFSRGLGYSKLDRHENVRRAGYVAGLLARHGVVVPVALISPYRAARNQRFFGVSANRAIPRVYTKKRGAARFLRLRASKIRMSPRFPPKSSAGPTGKASKPACEAY